jgi:hypothetical protein
MNKRKIIEELLNMVDARLFDGRPWLEDRETFSACDRKLIEMGLWERIDEPPSLRITRLGKELDVELFEVFMGMLWKWDVPIILEQHGLLTDSEFDAITESTSEADAETLLGEYVKRAYFIYRKVTKFLHSIADNRRSQPAPPDPRSPQ